MLLVSKRERHGGSSAGEGGNSAHPPSRSWHAVASTELGKPCEKMCAAEQGSGHLAVSSQDDEKDLDR